MEKQKSDLCLAKTCMDLWLIRTDFSLTRMDLLQKRLGLVPCYVAWGYTYFEFTFSKMMSFSNPFDCR